MLPADKLLLSLMLRQFLELRGCLEDTLKQLFFQQLQQISQDRPLLARAIGSSFPENCSKLWSLQFSVGKLALTSLGKQCLEDVDQICST